SWQKFPSSVVPLTNRNCAATDIASRSPKHSTRASRVMPRARTASRSPHASAERLILFCSAPIPVRPWLPAGPGFRWEILCGESLGLSLESLRLRLGSGVSATPHELWRGGPDDSPDEAHLDSLQLTHSPSSPARRWPRSRRPAPLPPLLPPAP